MTTILFFLFFSLSLFASPSYERDPLALVEGCVHALTGDLVLSADDLPEFPLHRVYVSREGKWNFTPHTRLILYGQKEKDKDKEKKKKKKDKDKDKDKEKYVYDLAKICEPSGCPVIYRRTVGENYSLELPKGFTNTARGAIGARNDLKNQRLFRNDTFTFTLTCPDGTKRIYKKAFAVEHDLHYLLSQEELPNGKVYQYEYDQQHRVYMIRSGSGFCRLQSIGLTDFDLESYDGKKISYRFAMQKDTAQLKRVEANGKEEGFDYTNSRLSKWKGPEGNTIFVEYGHDGKVSALKAMDGTLLHSFTYSEHQTEVRHANGSKTLYNFSPSLYLEKIETSTDTLEMKWTSDGQMLLKIRKNTEGEVLSSENYTYDASGNPIKAIINGEILHKEFDALNRVVKLKNKSSIEFRYLKNTDLISAKILTEEGRILRTFYDYGTDGELIKVTIDDGEKPTYVRVIEIEGGPDRPTCVIERADAILLKKTVYQYGQDGIIEEIYDADGSLRLKRTTSISGIHKPWKETIPIGVSQEDGYEVKRDYFGRVIAKRLYDQQGMLLEEETWTFNALYLLSFKDKTGLLTEYSYNREGRKVREVIHSNRGDIEKFFFYDSRGRVDKIQNGELITFFGYDEEDRVVEKWEEDLEEALLYKVAYAYRDGETFVTHYTSHSHATYPLHAKPSSPLAPEVPGITYSYDQQGRLIELISEDKTIHYSLQYNKRGQPVLIVDHVNGTAGRRNYDDLGNMTEETLQNGYTVKSFYDLRGRRTELTLPDASSIYYKWGAKYLEEIYRITDKAKYEYRHRFLHYDLAGFPTTQRFIEGFGELSFEIDNDLCISASNSRHMQERAEDLAPIEFDVIPKSYTFSRDALGRIVFFEGATYKIYYTYDIWNRRMSKRVREIIDGEWKETLHICFVYDGATEIGTMDVTEGWLKQLRVLAPYQINPGDQAVAYELEGMPYVPLHDLHGNVKKLLSVIRRKVMETYRFSYSGREQIADYWGDSIPISKANNPWRFRSEWIDEETGLVYINGNYYDPHQKAFIGNGYSFLERPHLFHLNRETQ